ncbi:hypothetical protein PINS_up022382 [Pythium insidiosum]|nr:hypothetical protein PINS_up022382 [Pythium insidiosum]
MPSPSRSSPNAAAPYNSLKRKSLESTAFDSQAYLAEQLKRQRSTPMYGQQLQTGRVYPQSAPHSLPMQPPQRTPSPVPMGQRSSQPLADHGRSMLAAWQQYAMARNIATCSGLAQACQAAFEEVKRSTTRVLSDANAGLNANAAAFVCLHHAYIVGIVCVIVTQSLKSSHMSNGDSMLVKTVADAFANALIVCMDPTPHLRERALQTFASAARQCEMGARPQDLSNPLHQAANIVLHFIQTTQYLAGGNFADLTACRPVMTHNPQGMSMLPASLLQHLRLLETIREAFFARIRQNNSALYGQGGHSASLASSSVLPSPQPRQSTSQLIHVDFDNGPLGLMINQSTRGTVIVTEFSNEPDGRMGQAQSSGKIAVGDELYAVNGKSMEIVGMEGFKAIVASGKRPLRVTFRRFSDASSISRISSSGQNNHMSVAPAATVCRRFNQTSVPTDACSTSKCRAHPSGIIPDCISSIERAPAKHKWHTGNVLAHSSQLAMTPAARCV